MNKSTAIRVRAMRAHTFAGQERNEGDEYDIEGDATQSAEQYAGTLRALSFADVIDAKAKHEAGTYETRDLKAKRR